METLKKMIGIGFGVLFSFFMAAWLIPEFYTMIVLFLSVFIMVLFPVGLLFSFVYLWQKKYLDNEKLNGKDWAIALWGTLIGIWWVFYFGVYSPFLTVVEFLTYPVK
jgi:hypothetical protein